MRLVVALAAVEEVVAAVAWVVVVVVCSYSSCCRLSLCSWNFEWKPMMERTIDGRWRHFDWEASVASVGLRWTRRLV